MSKYTTEVRFICESVTGHDNSVGYDDTNQTIIDAAPHIFDFDFPIFDPDYRLPLEVKILRHYYTREISEETVGLWKLRLQDRLNIIMPYYNKLYESSLLEFNPLYDVDLTTNHSGNNTGVVSGVVGENIGRENEKTNESNEIGDSVKNRSGNTEVGRSGEKAKSGSENENNEGIKVGNNDGYKKNEGSVNKSKTGSATDDSLKTNVTVNSGNENVDNTENTNAVKTGEYKGDSVSSNNSETMNRNSGENHGDSWSLYSDTPQGGIDGMNVPNSSAPSGLANNMYLTNATHDFNDDTNSSTGSQVSDNTSVGNETSESKENNSVSFGGNKVTVREDVESVDGSEQSKKIYDENNDETVNNSETTNGSFVESNSGNRVNNRNESESNSEREDSVFSESDVNNDQRRVEGRGNENETISRMRTDDKTSTSTDEYLQRVSGKSGGMTYSAMILEYRETFINIDEMIIEELSDLFFGLW